MMPKLGMEEIRKEQVIKATEKCIIEKGLSNISIKDIAAEAKLSTGIIYHYFKNKDDLLLQVLKEAFRKSHEQVIQTVEPIGDSVVKLKKHIEYIHAVPKDNPEFYAVLMSYLGEAQHNPKVKKIIALFFKNLRSYIVNYLSKNTSQAAEIQDRSRVELLAAMMIGLGLGIGIQWTIEPDFLNLEQLTVDFQDLLGGYFSRSPSADG